MKIREGAYMRFATTPSDDTVISFNLSGLARDGGNWIAGDVGYWIGNESYMAHYDVRLGGVEGKAPQDTPPADAPAPEVKTLRDEFAIAIVAAFLSRPLSDNELTLEQCRIVWDNADAMMEARKK